MDKSYNILNFGSLNIDNVYRVSHIVNPGETLSSLNYSVYVGGKGLNQSIAMGRAGMKVYHAGAVGTLDGEILLNTLKENGINIDNVIKKNKHSGQAFIQVDEEGQNSIVLYKGANHEIEKNDIDSILENFKKDDYLILQNEISNLGYIIDKAHENKIKIFLNLSPISNTLSFEQLNKVEWYLLNEAEAAALAKEKYFEKDSIIKSLTKLLPNANFIITCGSKGSFCIHEGEVYHQKIFTVKANDTTGAGDTYTGFFISKLIETNSIPLALKYASAASAIAVTKLGASSSIPTLKEVDEFIQSYKE